MLSHRINTYDSRQYHYFPVILGQFSSHDLGTFYLQQWTLGDLFFTVRSRGGDGFTAQVLLEDALLAMRV